MDRRRDRDAPNQPMFIGKEALRGWHQKAFDQFFSETNYSPDDAEVVGDWAFVRLSSKQTLTPKAGGETTEVTFKEVVLFNKEVVLFKRQPGGPWKVHWAIWNSEKPLPR